MRVLVAPGPGRLVMDEVPDPEPEAGQVLIRTRVTAVSSGTELRMLYRGQDDRSGGPGWSAIGRSDIWPQEMCSRSAPA
jgi:threonine dehydrogenase-like Zn-dependent dehydrogenase